LLALAWWLPKLGSLMVKKLHPKLNMQHSMPPRTISRRAIHSIAISTSSTPFTCPSCVLHKAAARASLRQRVVTLQNQRRRHASTFASPATVNKPLDISSDKRELYDALEALKKDAAPFVNLSRLQLALKSLEGGKSAVRVAVLGFGNGGRDARRLVRLLVADPLKEEGQWEGTLEGDVNEGRSLLVRYVPL
jgi:hypothetical protein